MSLLRARLALVALLALVACGQGATAIGAPSPAPPASAAPSAPHVPSPLPKAQKVAGEQSNAASSGRALGLRTGERLVVKDVISDPDGSTHVRYNRTFNGLRVIGGDLVSHRAKSGRLEGVSWNGPQGSPKTTKQGPREGPHTVGVPSTTPKVSLSSARAAGTRQASLRQRTTLATKAELVVYSGDTSGKVAPKLAYDVLTSGVLADQTPSRVHTIVDANTGKTLKSYDEIENGVGHGVNVGNVSISTTAGPPWSMRDTVGNYTTDLSHSVSATSAGTTFTDSDNVWGNGAVTDPASAGVDAQYGAEKTFDYFKNIQGRNGIRGNGAGSRSRVHYGNGYVNAFWDGQQMTYGDGAGNTHPLTELDVAGHEMTHGITENTAGLVGDGEAGGLNEATSDIFGTSVEWYAADPADVPDYLIGELINIHGDGTPLRYMDRPSRDGQSSDCWSSTLGDLDPHYSAGPLNHWFYLASEGSGAKVINGVSYNSPTCNASTVTPIGRAKAAKIWYRTLTTYLTSSNTYAAAREGAIQSAKDLYGDTSPECTAVAASFSAIAVPPGATTCSATTAPPPVAGSNLLSNPGFESGVTGWSPSPGVIAQWGSATPPQVVHSGTWGARFGGFESFHEDSISQLLTIPAPGSATLAYSVHIDTNEDPGPAPEAFDTMTVRAGHTALQTLSNLDAASGFQLKTVDLSAYACRTIALSFSGSQDGSLATSFDVDDTSLTTAESATVPGAATALTAVAGNTQADVSWTAPPANGGCPVTRYTVTASPGGQTATTTGATSATFTGLTNGTAYTFTVTATNAAGSSADSSASAAVTPDVAAPGTPTGVLATAGNGQAVVSWAAPASDGGSAITGYSVRVLDAATGAQVGDLRAAAAGATRMTVTGLVNGTSYRFEVQAGNGVGSGPPAVSNPVTAAPTAAVTRLSDFNRDGLTDLVARDSGGVLWLYPGDGAGGHLARRQLGTGWAGMTALVTPGDLTGDGNSDILARNAAGTLWLYPGNGASHLGTRRQIGAGWKGYTLTSAGNFNGAGRPDLLARSSTGVLYLYPFNGNGVLGHRTQIGTGWGAYTILGPGDVSGDRRADILARDAGGSLWLYRGSGAGRVTSRALVSTGWQARTALVTPGNWNRAAGNDVLMRDGAGRLLFGPGDNAGHFGPPPLVSTGWQSLNYIG